MFKHKIEDLIFYFVDNAVHSAPVLSRKYVDNGKVKPSNMEQEEFFRRFGETTIQYATCHGVFDESKVFGSREELIESLK